MVDAYNQMMGRGETAAVPLVALALTSTGGEATYAPMELDGYSDGEEWSTDAFQEYLPPAPSYEPHAEDSERDIPHIEDEKQAVDVASYFRCYRKMGIFGFGWTKAEYDWLEERLTDYNIGRINGYAQRRAHFFKIPIRAQGGEASIFR